MYTVIVGFSDVVHGSFSVGQKIESLPDGVDWLAAGFVKKDKPKAKPRKRPAKKGS